MTISESTKRRIENIINSKESIKEEQKGIKDAIKSLADEMGIKPAAVNRIISLIEKERAKGGGIIRDEKEIVDAAAEVVG